MSIIGFFIGFFLVLIIMNFIDDFHNGCITKRFGLYKYLLAFVLTALMPLTILALFSYIIWVIAKRAMRS